jgi:hypothetical protein
VSISEGYLCGVATSAHLEPQFTVNTLLRSHAARR